MELYLLSIEEIRKLPEEILMCKASANFSGWKTEGGYCFWWLRSPGYGTNYAAYVSSNGWGDNYGISVSSGSSAVRPALRLESDISSLKRDKDGNVIYGKLPDGTDIRWIDISEYLGEPTLLMKECLPEARRFDDKGSNDYETSEIKQRLDVFSKEMFTDELGCCKNAPYGYDIDNCPYQKNGCVMQCKQSEIPSIKTVTHNPDIVDKRDITVEDVRKLMNFLQTGEAEGYTFRKELHLTPEQAFSVVYYLQEELRIIPDNYEMCDECHNIYDSDEEGDVVKNKHFCDSCKGEAHFFCTIEVGDRVEILDPDRLPETDINGNPYEAEEEYGECIGIDGENYTIRLDNGVVISLERQYFIYAYEE